MTTKAKRRTAKKRHSFSMYRDQTHTPYSGKTDEELLVMAVNYARDVIHLHEVPDTYAIREPYLAISRETGSVYNVSDNMAVQRDFTPSTFKRRYIMRHPDLLIHRGSLRIFDLDERERLGSEYLGCWIDPARAHVIEFDGAVHDTPAGRKAYDRRQKDYEMASIPLTVVDMADGPPWRGTIDNIIHEVTP